MTGLDRLARPVDHTSLCLARLSRNAGAPEEALREITNATDRNACSLKCAKPENGAGRAAFTTRPAWSLGSKPVSRILSGACAP